jgi:hypothetical protein
MEDELVLTNKGTPMQQGSIRSADEEMKTGTLDTKGRLGMGSPEMDQRIQDDTHNPANEVCGHTDDLLYGSKTASKWNDIIGLHISGDIVTQSGYPNRKIILEKMDEVMPMPKVTDET